MNLNHLLDQVAAAQGDKVAIRFNKQEVKYNTFVEAVRRLSRGLYKLGIRRGDRVALMLPNLPQFPICYYAILRMGAVVVPVNIMYRGREATRLLEDSEVKAVIAWRSSWDDITRYTAVLNSIRQIILLGDDLPANVQNLTRLIAQNNPMADVTDVDDDDCAVIQYTTGATGTLKGAELTHRNISSNMLACREIMQLTERDCMLGVLPLFHPIGQTLVQNLTLCSGATLDLHTRFDPSAVVEAFRSGEHSLFVGVPSIYKILLDNIHEADAPPEKPVRLSICGAGAIQEGVLKQFEKVLGTYILECYTTSETSPVCSFNQWRTGRRVGSLGHPIPGVEMKVVDDRGNEASIGEIGEIIIKGSNVMKGYLNRPRLTSEVLRDGWFYTGDLGKMDINGFFYLVERKNDRIIKGGFSIYPTEVEGVMYNHPDVAEVAVVGVPDDVMGEEVKACVVLKADATVTTELLSDYCRERMALYKVPKFIRFYKDLPRTSTGRINRSELVA